MISLPTVKVLSVYVTSIAVVTTMPEAVKKSDRSIEELMKGMKEGAKDMIEGNTESDNSKIRDQIEKLREDL